LFAWRAPKMLTGGRFTWFSREALLLANNVVLLAAMGSVLLGTLYPLLMDALGMGKISVGPPYFNAVFVPLMAPALFLVGIGPLARWKEASLPDMIGRLKWALGIAVVTGFALPLTLQGFNPWATLGFFLAVWILLTVLIGFRERLKTGARLTSLPRAFWGMQLAHLGLAWGVAGITLVANYQLERDVKMHVGDHTELAGYTFTFKGTTERPGPNYRAAKGEVEVSQNGKKLYSLFPEKRIYNASGMPMTEAAIRYSLTSDVYVALGEPLDDEAKSWAVRVFHKPFINWLWIGALFLVAGGFLAASDRRYRIAVKKLAAPAGAAAQGA
ncbi:MAG TPA: cytochrome c-type biogenesis CcmF C-terminal domain-containing protein, partial [Thiobacillaceae bacterium]|nr:cytochrome c-type biogenesis CcmF C-terminal domain-containing protein [Thiobacillaceae bacterium]